MSVEQLKSFLAKVQADKTQQEKLNAEGVDPVAIAKEAGFSITTQDLNSPTEISDHSVQCYERVYSNPVLMSEEQLKAFLAKVKGDSSLQEKLQSAADPDAVVSIAKEAGFMISADDLKKAQSQIRDEELEGVVGGRHNRWFWSCSLCEASSQISENFLFGRYG